MTTHGLLLLGVYLVVLLALAAPLGAYLARVFAGEATWAQRVLGPLERLLLRAGRVDPRAEMTWKHYAGAVLLFNLFGLLVVYLLQRGQGALPLNPAQLGAVEPGVAFNTAISFASNTNWQAYGGETTMSYLTQMVGLTVQNFVSAATGIAVLVALVRGLTRRQATGLGNFWVDLVRATVYVLLPLALVLALVLVSQGVVQTLAGPPRSADRPGRAPTARPCSSRSSRAARRRRRSRSSSSAPTAAASSTPTPPTRSRTRRRSANFLQLSPSCSSPPRCASPSARWSATAARAGRCWRR
jgi:uncharacterized protein YhhL (DUF1145 family)